MDLRQLAGTRAVVRVSAEARDLIEDLKQACFRIHAAPSDDREEVESAYADYAMRSKELYQYIARLERELGVPTTTVTLRF